MKRKSRGFNILFFSLFLNGCVSGPCHSPSTSPRDEAKQQEADKMGGAQVRDGIKYVKVYKYDGSKQCETGIAIEPEKMAEQLEGIEVIKIESLNDGQMRPQFCGHETGQANVFTIPEADVPEAQKRGFRKWTFGNFNPE